MFQRVYRPGHARWDVAWDEFSTSTFDLTTAPSPALPSIWRDILDRKLENTLLVMPHAAAHRDLRSLLDHYWSDLPAEWDVVCLGAYCPTMPVHLAGHVMRPAQFMQVHGFAVRPRACQCLLRSDPSLSIERQLTALIADSLNVYALWPNLICPPGNSDYFVSFRELAQFGPSRLGNQLFQVAATLGSAARHGYRPLFPPWEHAKIFEERFDQSLELPAILSRHVENEFHYAEIPHSPNLDIVGFFQSPRYWESFENLIRHYFRAKPDLQTQAAAKREALGPRPTVGIHVRRGDYLSMPDRFRVLPPDYYRAAMSRFDSSHQFAIFSDDPGWCRQTFIGNDVHIISGNSDIVDMILMSLCEHQIIANSSFSWWAAWLNPNPAKRVIAPTPWFGPALNRHDTKDLYPPGWELLLC